MAKLKLDFKSRSSRSKAKSSGKVDEGGNWIQNASAKMEQKGTKGSFTRSAKKAGKTVAEQAASVLKKGSGASALQKKRAVFAQNMRKLANRKKGK